MWVPRLQTRQPTCDKYPANPAQIYNTVAVFQQSGFIGLAVSLGVPTRESAKPYVFSGCVDPKRSHTMCPELTPC